MNAPLATTARPIRVLIVDDSAFVRRVLARLLSAVPGVTVAGTAGDGAEALQRLLELRPDVVTMDVEMPVMDGLSTVKEIMRVRPTPIVMVSARTQSGTATAIRALEAGAVECVGKPGAGGPGIEALTTELGAAVLRASEVPVSRRWPTHQPASEAMHREGGRRVQPCRSVVVVVASTGGPPALSAVIPRLPAGLQAGVIVVQHMPAGFTGALARRLDGLSALDVAEAQEGDAVIAGRVFVAPGDYHLSIGTDYRVHLDQGPALHGVRPAADITLASAAEVYGARVTAAILTGMGRDGADGARKVEQAGGAVLVQDEATSVVYGMPRVARETTDHARELPIDEMAEALVRNVGKHTGQEAPHGRG